MEFDLRQGYVELGDIEKNRIAFRAGRQELAFGDERLIVRNARLTFETKPAKKWSAVAKYDAWWLADPHDGLYAAASTLIVRVANGAAGRFVGQELDGAVAYNFSRQFQFGGGFGDIFPGAFLNNATPGESYNYPYASTTLVF